MDDETRELIDEIAGRSRRMETKVTKIANHLGVDAGGARPVWVSPGRIEIPSRDCSLQQCLAAVPHPWTEDVTIWIKDDYVMSFNTR